MVRGVDRIFLGSINGLRVHEEASRVDAIRAIESEIVKLTEEELRARGDEYVRELFFFSSRRRHTRLQGDWSSDVCSSDLAAALCIAAAFTMLAAPAHAEKRVALVIGNNDYKNVPKLQKAVNDARTMGDTLDRKSVV